MIDTIHNADCRDLMSQMDDNSVDTIITDPPGGEFTDTDGVGVMATWKNRIIGSGEENPDQLLANPLNYRIHPKGQQDALAGVLDDIGWIQEVIVNQQTGHLIDGHLRVELALSKGEMFVPVKYVDLTEQEEKNILAVFDPISAMAGQDAEVLKTLIDQTNTQNKQVQKLIDDLAKSAGIEIPMQEAPEAQIDKAEELRAKWGVELGQLWQLGEHRLICGDCADSDVATMLLGDDKADMIFTDPPYGVAYVGGTKDALTIENDDVSENELRTLVTEWFNVCYIVSRPGAYWLATVPPGPLHEVFLSDWKQRGVLRQIMVWVKDSMVLGHSEYHYKHEPILFGWIPGGKRLKCADRTKTTVWEFDRPKVSREHPTMKPVAMWEYGIFQHTMLNDIVYEPFSGSGTCIVACERLRRKCRAIEISPVYCAVSIQRWVDMTGGEPMLLQ